MLQYLYTLCFVYIMHLVEGADNSERTPEWLTVGSGLVIGALRSPGLAVLRLRVGTVSWRRVACRRRLLGRALSVAGLLLPPVGRLLRLVAPLGVGGRSASIVATKQGKKKYIYKKV